MDETILDCVPKGAIVVHHKGGVSGKELSIGTVDHVSTENGHDFPGIVCSDWRSLRTMTGKSWREDACATNVSVQMPPQHAGEILMFAPMPSNPLSGWLYVCPNKDLARMVLRILGFMDVDIPDHIQ